MKSWYSVRILYQSHIDGIAVENALFEESIRLFEATNVSEARERAERAARDSEHSYANNQGQIVSWHLVALLEIQDLCESAIEDGMEVFSRMFRQDGELTAIETKPN